MIPLRTKVTPISLFMIEQMRDTIAYENKTKNSNVAALAVNNPVSIPWDRLKHKYLNNARCVVRSLEASRECHPHSHLCNPTGGSKSVWKQICIFYLFFSWLIQRVLSTQMFTVNGSHVISMFEWDFRSSECFALEDVIIYAVIAFVFAYYLRTMWNICVVICVQLNLKGRYSLILPRLILPAD